MYDTQLFKSALQLNALMGQSPSGILPLMSQTLSDQLLK